MINLREIDKSWSLFLDRDGVINHEKHLDYIYNYGEFVYYEGVDEAMRTFARNFGKIFIVTNQRGVGKGLMTESDLNNIHKMMVQKFRELGCEIHGIYYCTSLDDGHPDRKPNPGMAFRAKQEYPEVELSRSIIVGNNLSDMEFGRNAGMHTVFVQTTHPHQPLPHPAIDYAFKDLLNFSRALPPA